MTQKKKKEGKKRLKSLEKQYWAQRADAVNRASDYFLSMMCPEHAAAAPEPCPRCAAAMHGICSAAAQLDSSTALYQAVFNWEGSLQGEIFWEEKLRESFEDAVKQQKDFLSSRLPRLRQSRVSH